MPIIKNPFKKQDENAPPPKNQIKTTGIDIKQPTEYKLSEISDTGEYLPPSPPDNKKAFWSRSASTNTSSKRSVLDENEPFNISRESFDSYRRSFDISARSPVIQPRASLDSRMTLASRPSYSASGLTEPTKEEDDLEEVALKEDEKPRKRFFPHFGDKDKDKDDGRPPSSHGFHLMSRKRASSGAGAEMGTIDK